MAKGFGRSLFRDVSFDIERGQRWAMLGPNGCGKTTLLRCLLDLESPDAGRIHLGQGVMVGYFDQQLAQLPDDQPVADSIQPGHKRLNMNQRRSLLARFGLRGDTALQTAASLSGGERCRAALARLAAADANFLILDEPTNHLDLWARDALEKALSQFDGTVLMVSHDRYFVNRVADHLLVVEPDRVRVIEGNYDTYTNQLANPSRNSVEQAAEPPRRSEDRDKPDSPKSARRRFPFRKVVEIENEIIEREAKVEELQRHLLDPSVLRDGPRVREIKTEIQAEQTAVQTLYEHWDEAVELNW